MTASSPSLAPAPPSAPTANDVREVIRRLAAVEPGSYRVVSCYLKLEPRDKTRGKYLIKMKNRIREALAALERQVLDRTVRDQVAGDMERVRRYFEEPARLPAARAVAVFACATLDLFAVVPLPHVHRSRLQVEPTPLIRELLALEQEFGTILVAACDRTGARFFEVTAFDVAELPGLTAGATRVGKFHGERQAKRGGVLAGGFGEHNFHMRIREEKHRHYAAVADRIYQIHSQRPLAGLVVAGIGVDAAALVPHLHTYLHDLLLGVVKLNPKKASPAEVRDAALFLREQRERAWERAHAAAVKEGLGTGWAVNGIEPTLKALSRGQVRTLLADGQIDDPRIDDAVEEALRQRAQVDVVYDEQARRAVQRLAALLRFRR
jgi:peptide chain release factor subunit 1